MYPLFISGGLEEFGGTEDQRLQCLISRTTGFSRMSQWDFVEREVVRERNFDVGIINFQKLSGNRFKVVSREVETVEVLEGPLSFKVNQMNLLWDKE